MDVERKIFLRVMVTRLPKGKMYAGGTIDNFQNLTVWRGGRVMAEVTFLHGWHTVLINMELDISKMNTDQFRWGVNWQQVLMALVEDHHGVNGEEARAVISE